MSTRTAAAARQSQELAATPMPPAPSRPSSGGTPKRQELLRRLVHALARQAVGEQRRREFGGSIAGIIMPLLVIAALVALAMYLAPVLFHAH